MAGECLGCQTQVAVDMRLPLPATCPDYGNDVLARADIEGPETQRQLPFDPPRIREDGTMTLPFRRGSRLRD